MLWKGCCSEKNIGEIWKRRLYCRFGRRFGRRKRLWRKGDVVGGCGVVVSECVV